MGKAESALFHAARFCLTRFGIKNLKVKSQRQININKFVRALAFSRAKFCPLHLLVPPHLELRSMHMTIIREFQNFLSTRSPPLPQFCPLYCRSNLSFYYLEWHSCAYLFSIFAKERSLCREKFSKKLKNSRFQVYSNECGQNYYRISIPVKAVLPKNSRSPSLWKRKNNIQLLRTPPQNFFLLSVTGKTPFQKLHFMPALKKFFIFFH